MADTKGEGVKILDNNYICIDGKKIEAFNDGVYIDDVRVSTVEELEYVMNVIIKSVIAMVQG